MALIYKFKKERLENGIYVSRPRILVSLRGSNMNIEVPALIDSGCDTTVIPLGLAKAVGISLEGKKDEIHGFREISEAILSKAQIEFKGRVQRENVKLPIPVLIVLPKEGEDDDQEIVLGIDGIFDYFDISFQKSKNKIILKKSGNPLKLLIKR